jgi:hypothetical protein
VKEGCSFLEKLLPFAVTNPASVNAKEQKSFASFLQKRRPSPFSLTPSATRSPSMRNPRMGHRTAHRRAMVAQRRRNDRPRHDRPRGKFALAKALAGRWRIIEVIESRLPACQVADLRAVGGEAV